MKFRNIAMALTFAAGIAGIANSHAEDPRVTASAGRTPADPVVASFRRDLDRQPGPTTAPEGRAVEIDVLYVLINRPLQTPAEQAVAAGKGE